MCDDYKIGADVKCKKDASVISYVPADDRLDPDREAVLQMMGRGQRARGDYCGIVFKVEKEFMTEAFETKIKDNGIEDEYCDATANIKLMVELQKYLGDPKLKKKPQTVQMLFKSAKLWKIPINDFINQQVDGIRPLMLEAYQKLPKYNKQDRE